MPPSDHSALNAPSWASSKKWHQKLWPFHDPHDQRLVQPALQALLSEDSSGIATFLSELHTKPALVKALMKPAAELSQGVKTLLLAITQSPHSASLMRHLSEGVISPSLTFSFQSHLSFSFCDGQLKKAIEATFEPQRAAPLLKELSLHPKVGQVARLKNKPLYDKKQLSLLDHALLQGQWHSAKALLTYSQPDLQRCMDITLFTARMSMLSPDNPSDNAFNTHNLPVAWYSDLNALLTHLPFNDFVLDDPQTAPSLLTQHILSDSVFSHLLKTLPPSSFKATLLPSAQHSSSTLHEIFAQMELPSLKALHLHLKSEMTQPAEDTFSLSPPDTPDDKMAFQTTFLMPNANGLTPLDAFFNHLYDTLIELKTDLMPAHRFLSTPSSQSGSLPQSHHWSEQLRALAATATLNKATRFLTHLQTHYGVVPKPQQQWCYQMLHLLIYDKPAGHLPASLKQHLTEHRFTEHYHQFFLSSRTPALQSQPNHREASHLSESSSLESKTLSHPRPSHSPNDLATLILKAPPEQVLPASLQPNRIPEEAWSAESLTESMNAIVFAASSAYPIRTQSYYPEALDLPLQSHKPSSRMRANAHMDGGYEEPGQHALNLHPEGAPERLTQRRRLSQVTQNADRSPEAPSSSHTPTSS